ncbi:putative molibdopterin-dependent oxidoreductase YjgC, partial [Anaerosolibacter carboniphilus]
ANALSTNMEYTDPDQILHEISIQNHDYFKIDKQQKDQVYWPVNDSPVLYGHGFHWPDGKARLQIVEDGILFERKHNTDNLTNTFVAFLEKEQLV